MPLNPQLASTLIDARLQSHHAVQLATAAGISYLTPRPDDSHTNLEWMADAGMLASNLVMGRAPFRLAVRVADLTFSVLDSAGRVAASLALGGRTVADAVAWLRPRLGDCGADPDRYTLAKHYEIPPHPVDSGAPFQTNDTAAFEQLALWFDAGFQALDTLRVFEPHVSEIRCWPHHFDIGVVIDEPGGATIGVGLEPGDGDYDEPYFYVNRHPQPSSPPPVALAGDGSWHDHEWIGAVLPGSRISDSRPLDQVDAFLRSAIHAFR